MTNETSVEYDRKTRDDGGGDCKERQKIMKRWAHKFPCPSISDSWANLVIAIVTVIVAPVAIYQISLMRAANDLSRDSAQKQLRAYVTPSKAQFVDNNGRKPYVRITVKNSGQTPALNLSIELNTFWVPYPPPTEAVAGALPGSEGTQVVLAAGEEMYVDHEVEASHIRLLRAKKEVLECWGHVEYQDVFEQPRSSRFHFVQGGDHDPAAALMTLAEEGNTLE